MPVDFEFEDDRSWNGLLNDIETRQVLPRVGPGVTTFGEEDQLLAPWLAQKLAAALEVQKEKLPAEFSVNDVFVEYMINGGDQDEPYKQIFGILKEGKLKPGETLNRLASVSGLRVFITTTSDSLLSDALASVRHGGRGKAVSVLDYTPTLPADLPDYLKKIESSTVLHVLGKVANASDCFAGWDEDVLEYICGLNSHLIPGLMPNLSCDLANKNNSILALGLNFSDWLLRFFLRVARQKRLSSSDHGRTYVAQTVKPISADTVVMYFGRLAKRIQILNVEPRKFVHELARRWQERHPGGQMTLESPGPAITEVMQPGDIFISYVREDEAAVRNIATRLQQQGCKVWLDLTALKSGMDFDLRIKDYVMKSCCLMVSVISKQTESESEAYFHRERNWAAERVNGMAEAIRDLFYHPVIIDETDAGKVALEPRRFREVHRPTFLQGEVSDEFCRRLFDLQLACMRERGLG